jgi:hypothetical protein
MAQRVSAELVLKGAFGNAAVLHDNFHESSSFGLYPIADLTVYDDYLKTNGGRNEKNTPKASAVPKYTESFQGCRPIAGARFHLDF